MDGNWLVIQERPMNQYIIVAAKKLWHNTMESDCKEFVKTFDVSHIQMTYELFYF